jgi:hypothetical protein
MISILLRSSKHKVLSTHFSFEIYCNAVILPVEPRCSGGQAFSQMIFFEDKRAYDEFTSGNFEFDASASAVAITAGVEAKAGTEGATASATAGPATGAQAKTSYHKGMAVFTHAKGGLMYEASIGGQKFSFKAK